MALNEASPIPLYRQLAEQLHGQIRSGALSVGSRIPSEHELSARYRVGRPTVRQATELLVRRGVLARRRGSGTYVCEPPPAVDLFSLSGTSAAFEQQGLAVQVELTSALERGLLGGPENPLAGREVYRVSRLFRVDGLPVVLEHLWLDAATFEGLERFSLGGQSLSEIVADEYFLVPQGAVQTFRVVRLPASEARLLEISPRTAVLSVHRRLSFPSVGECIVVQMQCRTDRYVFSQHLVQGALPGEREPYE